MREFFWNPDRQVGMEVHMDDVHCFGPDPQVEKFKEDLAAGSVMAASITKVRSLIT